MSTHDEALSRAVRDLALQIAIDGPAGAGKSTVGRSLARALQCSYLDTGLMYRAVTLHALERGVPISNQESLAGLAGGIRFELQRESNGDLRIDGSPPSDLLHSTLVDEAVSEVSAHPAVRAVLVQRQRELADDRCIVMVGRDIGTTVLPDAPVKLWITASAAARANRRGRDRAAGEHGTPVDDMRGWIERRDAFDSGRAASPLRRAPEAAVIDTDASTPAEVLERALDEVGAAVVAGRRSRPHLRG